MKNWDSKQKQAFTNAFGKRQKFAKGGVVRRKYFDTGGTVLGGPSNMAMNNAVNPNTGIVGTIGGALGLNDNFEASSANIQGGTNADQLNNAYTGAQTGLNTQGTITNAFVPQAASAVANQNAVANQLTGIINGTGPNPALAQLNQTTGQNTAATGAALAGARGASGNVGLMARNIGQQAAQNQQAAVGQGATLAAQQQMTAGQNLAGVASNQAAQAQGAATAENTAQQNEQNILQGANTAFNNAGVGMQSNINNVNSQTALANQQEGNGILGGVTSGISSALGALGFAKGGEVEPHMKLAEMNAHSLKKFADGGPVYNKVETPAGPMVESTPQANIVKHDVPKFGKLPAKAGSDEMAGGPNDVMSNDAPMSPGAELASDPIVQMAAAHGGEIDGPHQSHVANFLFAKGGPVPAMVSEGEVYLNPQQVTKVINEGADPKKIGTHIKAKNKSQRAKVKGDSYSNDKIPMTLEDGGVVVDRKNMKTAEKRKLFVHESVARKKAGTR